MARDTVAEVKERLSIVDVVGGVVKLRKAGRSYIGLCPFHKEKTGSFHVSLERGSYHCFGCGEGGDMFTFIEKTEGVDFKGALKMLAERAGVPLEYSGGNKKEKEHAERLREAMAAASVFYAAQLSEDSSAYAYARSRDLQAKTITEWNLGYAPDTWRAVLEALTAQGFSLEELIAAGLIKEADRPGTYYDRLRNRLIFPIRDSAGRVVAFTGRALSAEDPAKYLNSPETELYHKSEILFGLDKAKDALRQRSFAILVEGQMDLLAAHQAGFANVVAVSGTAFTAAHARLVKRYAENLLLCLDADRAGLAATQKAALLALGEGMQVKIARLPEGKDPADLIGEDPQLFARAIKEAKTAPDFFLGILAEREKDQHKLVRAAEKVVLPLIRAVGSSMEREHFVASTARALGISPEAVKEAMGRLPHDAAPAGGKPGPKARPAPATSPRASRINSLAAIARAYPDSPLAKRINDEYSRIVDAPLLAEVSEADIFSVETAFNDDPPEHAADDLIRAFEEAHLREAYQEKVGNLRRAETAGNPEEIKEAEHEVETLRKRLKSVAG